MYKPTLMNFALQFLLNYSLGVVRENKFSYERVNIMNLLHRTIPLAAKCGLPTQRPIQSGVFYFCQKP